MAAPAIALSTGAVKARVAEYGYPFFSLSPGGAFTRYPTAGGTPELQLAGYLLGDPATYDLNYDGMVDVADVALAAGAAITGQCVI